MLNHTELKQRSPFLKSILILDDDPDVVLTFKEGLEAENSKKIQNDNVATLDEDYLDAALYLAHSFHILGLSKSLNLLLSVIVNEKLARDTDVRRLIILLSRALEPRNAELYVNTYGNTFRKRYELYREGLRKEGI